MPGMDSSSLLPARTATRPGSRSACIVITQIACMLRMNPDTASADVWKMGTHRRAGCLPGALLPLAALC